MNILHIIDDEKFIGLCIKTFKIEHVKNHYLKSNELSKDFLKQNKIDTIFIHFLKDSEVAFLSENNITTPIIWMFWGADGFSLPGFYSYFLDQQSKRFLYKIKISTGFVPFMKHFIKLNFKSILNHLPATKTKLSVINNFDSIVPIVPGDYHLIKDKYKVTAPLFHFNYVTPIENKIDSETKNVNILLGNSADITNNHISVLEELQKHDLRNRKVYIPLNYGNTEYKEHLLGYLNKMDNEGIIPIIDFMPFNEYSEMINSCSIMIMNHHRQQALGNIIIGFCNGCTIYMSSKSSLYDYLTSKGFIIKEMENLSGFSEISNEDKTHNFKLTKETFGEERQIELVSKLLSEINISH